MPNTHLVRFLPRRRALRAELPPVAAPLGCWSVPVPLVVPVAPPDRERAAGAATDVSTV